MGTCEKKKLNILLASAKVRAGGEAVHVYTLAKELTEMGHEVSLITCAEGGGMCGTLLKNRIYYAPFGDHRPNAAIKSAACMKKVLREHSFDVVHCHGRDSAFAVKCSGVSVPYVFTCHSLSLQTDVLHRALTSYGRMGIAVSGASKKFMAEGLRIPEDKIRVVHNGVDPSALTPLSDEEKKVLTKRFMIPEGSRIACMHGRFDPRKNHITIGRALADLSPEVRSKLVILCSGNREVEAYRKLVGELGELGVLPCFRFTGWTPTREILGMSDLLLSPSTEESFLMTALEGFFMHVPVVRSKTGGYEEMKDICTGLDASDVQGWRDVLSEFANCGNEGWAKKADAAYEYAMSHFTSRIMAENILDVYREVM